jgi:ABC-type branched-subunit amino acid transport system substrate-binding protein
VTPVEGPVVQECPGSIDPGGEPVAKVRNAIVIGALLVSLTALSVGTATAQSSNEKPQATEVGVTASEIHIAVVADVDNPFAPGLFKGAVDGVKAGAAYLNSKAAGGGLAGRKVVVDFYDSKLNGNESRNATIQSCQNDYALVGTSALFLTQVEDIVNCKDQAGQATGIPDLSAISTGVPESCSPMAFPAFGTQIDCASVTANPQTFNVNQGPPKWELSQHKGGLHGVTIIGNDTKDAARGGTLAALAAQAAGIKMDQGDPAVAVSGRDPQSVFTPIVQRMKQDSSNWALNIASANQGLLLRNEATLQGIDPKSVLWECSSCYGNALIKGNAQAFEGEVQQLGFLPFEEASVNKTVANFVKYMKQVGGTPDQFAAYSYAAVLAFADAVNAVVKSDGVNGLTRANLITAIKGLTDFDAGGMLGKRSFKDGKITQCFMITQFKSGKWVRQYPTKKGTFDCKASNAITVKGNLIG